MIIIHPVPFVYGDGIHVAVYIIYTDIPDSEVPVLFGAIDIDAQVEPVISG